MDEGNCVLRHPLACLCWIDDTHIIDDAVVFNDSLAIEDSPVNKRNEEAGLGGDSRSINEMSETVPALAPVSPRLRDCHLGRGHVCATMPREL
jgi:hypothetical protein